jgi:hypothetical protein
MAFPPSSRRLDQSLLPLALLALSLLGGLLLGGPHAPALPKPQHAIAHRAPAKRIAARKPAPKPPVKPAPPKPQPPDPYVLEQAMSYGQLMNRWSPQIEEASRRFKISGLWIRAVIQLESGGRTMLAPGRRIVSTAGAMGLMQLMPQTWADMRAQENLGRDPFDPHDNIIAGTAYLHALYKQYGYPTMFAAYNDGPGMLAAHAALNQPVPAETAAYVRDIASILSTGVRFHPGGKRSLAPLTRPDGTAVMVDAGAVVSIRAALPGEYADSVQSVISIGRIRQGVREPVAKATAVLRAHGALL